ncbi:hypothetical protein [Desertimonas flava]|uniref:hypothetical protein n=1 Tax=Desertimonas flava TaxID=2064846 RepID=UPI000E350EC5|nr:hypothetical protein [Desertimonas flava]
MRTRTLLLLAVGCGLAILVAGTVFLLQLANDDQQADFHAVGESVEVGDLHVVVDDYDETDDTATVSVTLGGVDDADGIDEFRLVLADASLSPVSGADGACTDTTVADQSCTLTFDLADDAPGGSRILLYRRGDDVARWELHG